jgi:hypothetical protein
LKSPWSYKNKTNSYLQVQVQQKNKK